MEEKAMRDLTTHVLECMEMLDAIGIEYGNIKEVTVNTRAKRRWGQCRAIPGGFSININADLLDERNSVEGLENTIIHELLHSCKGCMNHSEKWKALARKVKSAYGYEIKRCGSSNDKGVEYQREITYKYIIQCENCKRLIKRQRKSVLVEYPCLYKCGTCGGNLHLI